MVAIDDAAGQDFEELCAWSTQVRARSSALAAQSVAARRTSRALILTICQRVVHWDQIRADSRRVAQVGMDLRGLRQFPPGGVSDA